jgi:hypothetical protein
MCVDCAKGMFSHENSSMCLYCPPGYQSNVSGECVLLCCCACVWVFCVVLLCCCVVVLLCCCVVLLYCCVVVLVFGFCASLLYAHVHSFAECIHVCLCLLIQDGETCSECADGYPWDNTCEKPCPAGTQCHMYVLFCVCVYVCAGVCVFVVCVRVYVYLCSVWYELVDYCAFL